MRYVLGIDLGTSAVKAALYDENCRKVCDAGKEYPLSCPQNGWAEQNAEDWYRAAAACIRQAIAQSGVRPQDIVSVGLSGQMNGIVLLDKNGAPLRPAILWCDQRGAQECEEINARVGTQNIFDITCNPALTGFSLAKLLWVRNHQPSLYDTCRHIMLPKDYIRLRLTGEYATDVSDASGMQLLDTGKRCWSKQVVSSLGIDASLLPTVYESPEISGRVHETAAQETGLPAGIPVAAGAGDNAASAIGTGVVTDCRSFLTLGTSGVIDTHSDTLRVDPQGRVHTFCAAVPGAWLIVASVQSAGLSMQWMRNLLFPGDSDYAQVNQAIASVPIGAQRLLYLPYLMGDRSPHMDPDARGVFFGLSSMHTREHLARAVMEGISYGVRDCYGVLQSMGVMPQEMLLCGGGAKSPIWRQMLADVLGLPMRLLQTSDSGALGAAILAAVSAGIYNDVRQACAQAVKTGGITQPDPAAGAAYEAFYALYRRIYPHLQMDFKALSAL